MRSAAVLLSTAAVLLAMAESQGADPRPAKEPAMVRTLHVPTLADVPAIEAMPAASDIDAALIRPLPDDLVFDATPLRAALDRLQTLTHVRFELDDGAAQPDVTITLQPGGIPLASALSDMLRPHRLTLSVRGDVVHVMAGGRGGNLPVTRTYDVVDLIAPGQEDQLLTFLGEATWPLDSRSIEGFESLEFTLPRGGASRVEVTSPWWRQWRLARLLAILRRLRATPVADRRPVAADGYWSDSVSAAAARAALDRPFRTPVDLGGKSLGEAVVILAEAAGVPIGADCVAVGTAAGGPLDAPAADPGNCQGRTVAMVLERVLGDTPLTLDLARDRLAVTRTDWARHMFATALYPIDDLLADGYTFESLIEVIERAAAAPPLAGMPDDGTLAWRGGPTWVMEGGVTCLAITQTTAGHRTIEMFLRILRGAAPQPSSVREADSASPRTSSP